MKTNDYQRAYGKSRDEHVTMDKAQDLVDEWNSLREKTDNH